MAAVLEEHMKGREYLVGNSATIADFVMAYTLDWANEVQLLEELPNLKAYMSKMYARPNAAPRIAAAFASLGIDPRANNRLEERQAAWCGRPLYEQLCHLMLQTRFSRTIPNRTTPLFKNTGDIHLEYPWSCRAVSLFMKTIAACTLNRTDASQLARMSDHSG